MGLEKLNSLSPAAARDALAMCCVSERWLDGMLAAWPFASSQHAIDAANSAWDQLAEADFLQAFEGHPRIGDVDSLRAKYASSAGLASHEQSGVESADDELIARLAVGNAAYEDRFGFIFIVCASGKSAAEMLDLLEKRLQHSREQELAIAAEEQRKILLLRLENML